MRTMSTKPTHFINAVAIADAAAAAVALRREPPNLFGGRSALALRKKAANEECALALGTNSGACAAKATTRCNR